MAANPIEGLLLQDAEEFRLQRQVHFRDFVQKQRTAVGALEAAHMPPVRAGESPLLVAEQFALKQRRGKSRAIRLDDRMLRPGGTRVDGLGNQFLARARFTRDHHGGAAACHVVDDIVDRLHGGGAPDDALKPLPRRGLLPKRSNLGPQARNPVHVPKHNLQAAWLDRLGQVVHGARLHRLDGGVQLLLPGHHHGREIGVCAAQMFQQVDAVAVGQADIKQRRLRVIVAIALQSLLIAASQQGTVAMTLDHVREHGSDFGIVFQDEKSHWLSRIESRSSGIKRPFSPHLRVGRRFRRIAKNHGRVSAGRALRGAVPRHRCSAARRGSWSSPRAFGT